VLRLKFNAQKQEKKNLELNERLFFLKVNMNIRHLINQLQEIVSKHGEDIEVGFKDREPTYFTEAMYVM
jgi:hypothetical protein